jgi:hypothetical protein
MLSYPCVLGSTFFFLLDSFNAASMSEDAGRRPALSVSLVLRPLSSILFDPDTGMIDDDDVDVDFDVDIEDASTVLVAFDDDDDPIVPKIVSSKVANGSTVPVRSTMLLSLSLSLLLLLVVVAAAVPTSESPIIIIIIIIIIIVINVDLNNNCRRSVVVDR